MSKRRLESEIDEVSDEVLGDLSPDERLQLVLQSRAEGNEQEVDQLMRTCPRYGFLLRDREFTNRLRLADRYANDAMYELHTMYLEYKLVTKEQYYQQHLDEKCDTTPFETEPDRKIEQVAKRSQLLVGLYTSYHAHRRFATEILDVDFETWVGVHYPTPIVINAVTSEISNQERVELANRCLTTLVKPKKGEASDSDQTAPDGESMTLDDRVEIQYEALRSAWEDEIGE